MSRALRILNTLLKAFDLLGQEVTKSSINIFNETIKFSLEEKVRRSDHIPSKAEKEEMKNRPWSFSKKWDYQPTGKLSLRYDSWLLGSEGLRKTWSDGKTQTLEDLVVDFVIGGIIICDVSRRRRIIREQEESRKQEEIRIRAQAERKRQLELERHNILEKQAEQWNKSHQLREYIRAVEATLYNQSQDKEQKSRINTWLTWARQHADSIDPLAGDPLSIYEII